MARGYGQATKVAHLRNASHKERHEALARFHVGQVWLPQRLDQCSFFRDDTVGVNEDLLAENFPAVATKQASRDCLREPSRHRTPEASNRPETTGMIRTPAELGRRYDDDATVESLGRAAQ